MLKPIIGLNADFANSNRVTSQVSPIVASGYYDAVSKVGGIPVIIPPLENDDDLEPLLDQSMAWCWSAAPISIRVATAACCIRRFARLHRGANCSIAA